jgi:hypothetical protein
MQLHEARELAARLRSARPQLAYFPHRYAAWLLARAAGTGTPARSLKQRHARLLDNGLVRQIASRAPGGVLTRQALEQVEARRAEVYRIDFAVWGGQQTTRPGVNLVLLLNFPPQHDAAYRRWLDPDGALPAQNGEHPRAKAPALTMSWARLDIDLAAGEALIEEVQNDWLRRIAWMWDWVSEVQEPAWRDRVVQLWFDNPRARFDHFEHYWLRVLAHHRSWWAEATLFAALWLLVEQLQIRRVFYHTHEGGLLRKRIGGRAPPRSLYTELPRRFGFELTRKSPALLQRLRDERKRQRDPVPDELPWYRLVV